MKNTLVLINGRAGAGKDTFVDFVRKDLESRGFFLTHNKTKAYLAYEALKTVGWDGEKTDYSRTLLKDLIEFADSTGAATDHFNTCLKLYAGLLFYHVRDQESVNHYAGIARFNGWSVLTLFVHSDAAKEKDHQWDDLESYHYDYRILNNGSLEDLQKEAKLFADLLLKRLEV